jgi:LysR family transcriptional regulator, nitrogen assimilation regulatory protein
MDIRQLRYFKTVAEIGSFSAAARYLGVAQPALSRHVKALEGELGVVLLHRGVRGIDLTPFGERLLHSASALLRQFEMLPDVVSDRDEVVSGRVVVGLPTSVNAVLAQPLISAAMARLPAVQLHVIESLSGFLSEWIEAGRLDICILYDADAGSMLDLETILIEDLYLLGRAGAMPEGCREIPFQRLADLPLAMPGPPHSLRRLLDTMAISHGVRLNIVVEVDSLTIIKAIAERENLFTLLPMSAAYDELQAGRLQAHRIVTPSVSRSVSIATSTVRGRTRACEEVRRLILEISHDLEHRGIWKKVRI